MQIPIKVKQRIHEADARIAELEQQVARLQIALAFWLPSVPAVDHPIAERLCNDANLLCGLDADIVPDAETLGWVTLNRTLMGT
jgi:hypothetical protein